jgi:hypothetical protein
VRPECIQGTCPQAITAKKSAKGLLVWAYSLVNLNTLVLQDLWTSMVLDLVHVSGYYESAERDWAEADRYTASHMPIALQCACCIIL